MKRFILGAFFLFFLALLLFTVVVAVIQEFTFTNDYSLQGTIGSFTLQLPPNSLVYRYQGLLEDEMRKQELSTYYLPLLMAIMQQESGGNAEATGGDVMQSSESIDGNLGNITSVEASITQGVKYFKSLITSAGKKGITDLRVVLQSYNYGPGFMDYALSHGGAYSQELAQGFREKMRVDHAWEGYGDPHYVPHVLRYVSIFQGEKRGALVFPVPGKPYCSYGFGFRIHPLFNTPDFHKGMDFLAPEGTPMFASMLGKVEVVNNASMGLCVITRYEEFTIYYMHMSHTDLRTGDFIREGDPIGLMGNTGTSTTPHLHFQLEIHGSPVDPAPYFHPDDYVRGF